jgi:hypothetical protein
MWIVKLALRRPYTFVVIAIDGHGSMGTIRSGRAASDGRHPPIQRIVKTRQHFVGGIV